MRRAGQKPDIVADTETSASTDAVGVLHDRLN